MTSVLQFTILRKAPTQKDTYPNGITDDHRDGKSVVKPWVKQKTLAPTVVVGT
jgi:hypothetical protein